MSSTTVTLADIITSLTVVSDPVAVLFVLIGLYHGFMSLCRATNTLPGRHRSCRRSFVAFCCFAMAALITIVLTPTPSEWEMTIYGALTGIHALAAAIFGFIADRATVAAEKTPAMKRDERVRTAPAGVPPMLLDHLSVRPASSTTEETK